MAHLSQEQSDRASAICTQIQETCARAAKDLAATREAIERNIAETQAFLDRHNAALAKLEGRS